LQQLELLLTMVVVPYVGKYFGRKCAYWGELAILWFGAEGSGRGWLWRDKRLTLGVVGWAKFMEWKYPVEVVVTSKKTFSAAGAVEAAATL